MPTTVATQPISQLPYLKTRGPTTTITPYVMPTPDTAKVEEDSFVENDGFDDDIQAD